MVGAYGVNGGWKNGKHGCIRGSIMRTRRKCRPRKRRMEAVKGDIREATVENWPEVAKNRKTWKEEEIK